MFQIYSHAHISKSIFFKHMPIFSLINQQNVHKFISLYLLIDSYMEFKSIVFFFVKMHVNIYITSIFFLLLHS